MRKVAAKGGLPAIQQLCVILMNFVLFNMNANTVDILLLTAKSLFTCLLG